MDFETFSPFINTQSSVLIYLGDTPLHSLENKKGPKFFFLDYLVDGGLSNNMEKLNYDFEGVTLHISTLGVRPFYLFECSDFLVQWDSILKRKAAVDSDCLFSKQLQGLKEAIKQFQEVQVKIPLFFENKTKNIEIALLKEYFQSQFLPYKIIFVDLTLL